MKILVSLSNLDNAKLMGFGKKIWYHGGFEHFDEFDPKRSGSGTFNFTSDKKFAEQYARTKSQDGELDANIIVRAFYLPKHLFDYKNKSHIKKLAAVLPEKLNVSSSYGWAAWGGPRELTKQQVLDEVQCIAVPFTGLDEETKQAIRKGAKTYRRDGGMETVISYDKNTDTVEYVPSYQMDSIIGLRSNIAFMEKEFPSREQYPAQHFQIFQDKQKLKGLEEKLKTYKLKLSPGRKKGYDNWQIMESESIRPYLKKLGFLGAIMREGKHETACVFDAKNIRLVDAKFDLKNKNSRKLHASNYIAKHYTTEEAKQKILQSGEFSPSKSGWLGAGLYAHIGNGNEGKGKAIVEFDYSDLKLSTEDKPVELSDSQWNKLRQKSDSEINTKLSKLGYDGYLLQHKGWILVFPKSVNKIHPLTEN